MGTNYYVRLKDVEDECVKTVRKLLDEEHPIEKIKDYLCYSEFSYDNYMIHIGKSSYGWMFLFEQNKKYYENTRESINNFLLSHKDDFYDEYDEKVDIDEFWKLVDSKKGLLDDKSYRSSRENSDLYFPTEDTDFITEEGLRFSTFKDFC